MVKDRILKKYLCKKISFSNIELSVVIFIYLKNQKYIKNV